MSSKKLSDYSGLGKPVSQRVMTNKSNADEVVLCMWNTVQASDELFETPLKIYINGEEVYSSTSPGNDGFNSVLSAVQVARIYFDDTGLSKDLKGQFGTFSHGLPYYHLSDMSDYTEVEKYKEKLRKEMQESQSS